MALSMSNYDAVLKEAYEVGLRGQLNDDVPILRNFQKSTKTWSGRRVVYAAGTSRNSGVGARAENAALPTAGQQGTNQVIVSATYQYGRFRVTGQTIAAGKNAFVEALSLEMDGLKRDTQVDLSRQLWGMGDGRIAQTSVSSTAASGTTVVLLKNRFTRAGHPGARYFTLGQVVDLGSIANGALGLSQTISAITVSTDPATTTDTITLGNSACAFSACEVFVYNNLVGGTGGVGREMMGLQGIVDQFTEANMWGSNAFWSANLFGIARSTTPAWNGIVLGNSGVTRICDSLLLQTALDEIHQQSGEEADLIMGHHSVVRALYDSLVADRRFSTPTLNAGGAKGMTFDGIAVERDVAAPYNTLLVAKRSALNLFVLQDFGFADRDGAILSRASDANGNQIDAWDGFLNYYANTGVVGKMKSLCMIRDIKTDGL